MGDDDDLAQPRRGGGPEAGGGRADPRARISDAGPEPVRRGLIDRYHLLVFPWILGAGKRMWSDTDKPRQKLELVESEAYGNGVQKLIYDVVGFDPEA